MSENTFFEAGQTYTDPTGGDPYKAPEQSTVFLCQAVLSHPATGDLIAVGWGRPGGQPGDDWSLIMVGQSGWDQGPWTVGDRWAGVV